MKLCSGRHAYKFMLTFLCLFILVSLAEAKPRVQRAKVQITHNGYEPASITLRRGIPAQITFLRTTDDTCAKEVVFRDYGIRRDLPLNQAVVISLTPKKAGEFIFACGMNMLRGKLIVR